MFRELERNDQRIYIFYLEKKTKAHDGIYVNYSTDAREKGLP